MTVDEQPDGDGNSELSKVLASRRKVVEQSGRQWTKESIARLGTDAAHDGDCGREIACSQSDETPKQSPAVAPPSRLGRSAMFMTAQSAATSKPSSQLSQKQHQGQKQRKQRNVKQRQVKPEQEQEQEHRPVQEHQQQSQQQQQEQQQPEEQKPNHEEGQEEELKQEEDDGHQQGPESTLQAIQEHKVVEAATEDPLVVEVSGASSVSAGQEAPQSGSAQDALPITTWAPSPDVATTAEAAPGAARAAEVVRFDDAVQGVTDRPNHGTVSEPLVYNVLPPCSESTEKEPGTPDLTTIDAIWRATIQGDIAYLESLSTRKVLQSARLKDRNGGHTIFWNAIAFQQTTLALWLLKRFPPGSHGGVDLTEVHPRRNDSLLHLCLYLNSFTEDAATLFRAIFPSDDKAKRSTGDSDKDQCALTNHNGQTFLHIAAVRMNFWVMQHVMSCAASVLHLFHVRDSAGLTPLEILLRRLTEVGAVPPRPSLAPMPKSQMPNWMGLARFAPTLQAGKPMPFIDLKVEVEEPSMEGGKWSVDVHRVVLGAASPALDAHIRKLSSGEPLRIDPKCCRSSKVLMFVVQFLYGTEAICDFSKDAFLLWQLFCTSAQYALPAALKKFAKSALLSSIAEPEFGPVVRALLQSADKVGLQAEEAGYVACQFLGSPDSLAACGSDDGQLKALAAALREVERSVLGSGTTSKAQKEPARTGAATAANVPNSSRRVAVAASAVNCVNAGRTIIPGATVSQSAGSTAPVVRLASCGAGSTVVQGAPHSAHGPLSARMGVGVPVPEAAPREGYMISSALVPARQPVVRVVQQPVRQAVQVVPQVPAMRVR